MVTETVESEYCLSTARGCMWNMKHMLQEADYVAFIQHRVRKYALALMLAGFIRKDQFSVWLNFPSKREVPPFNMLNSSCNHMATRRRC